MQDARPAPQALGRTATPLSAANTTSNRFAVTVRDLSEEDVARLPALGGRGAAPGGGQLLRQPALRVAQARPGLHREGAHARRLRERAQERPRPPSSSTAPTTRKVKQFWKEHWGDWGGPQPPPRAPSSTSAVLKWLRKHPQDFRGAFLRTEPRWRALQVFTYQSWLWNEGVRQYLRDVVGVRAARLHPLPGGHAALPARARPASSPARFASVTFPLLAPRLHLHRPARSRRRRWRCWAREA